jgi:hypothetical protein
VVALSAEAMPAAPAIMIAEAAAASQAVWMFPMLFNLDSIFKDVHVANECASTRL